MVVTLDSIYEKVCDPFVNGIAGIDRSIVSYQGDVRL